AGVRHLLALHVTQAGMQVDGPDTILRLMPASYADSRGKPVLSHTPSVSSPPALHASRSSATRPPRQMACGAGDFWGGEERSPGAGACEDTRFVDWLAAAV